MKYFAHHLITCISHIYPSFSETFLALGDVLYQAVGNGRIDVLRLCMSTIGIPRLIYLGISWWHGWIYDLIALSRGDFI